MLDYVCIFTKGGVLLWTWQLAVLQGNPINALIRTYLLEERSGESSFTYAPPTGPPYSLKWTFHNGLGLIFVAVYQKALRLPYVDTLLEQLKAQFAPVYKPKHLDYPEFTDSFKSTLAKLERGGQPQKHSAGLTNSHRPPSAQKGSIKAVGAAQDLKSGDDEADGEGGTSSDSSSREAGPPALLANGHGLQEDVGMPSSNGSTFDISKLSKKEKGQAVAGARNRNKKGPAPPNKKEDSKKDAKKPKKKEARKWDGSSNEDLASLDFSEQKEPTKNGHAGHEELLAMNEKSMIDEDEEVPSDDEGEDEETDLVGKGAAAKPAKAGFLSSLVRSMKVSLVGTEALSAEDIEPTLTALKKKLMERNVAADIADKICESVAASLAGKALSSFTRISSAVRAAVEAALHRILTPRRSIDVLREVRAAKAQGRPYTIVFVGVNGVGKSTNLAKIAYWLLQNGLTVKVAACDTFRSGAVEQLRTHCTRLGISLFQRGYEKDPAKVAHEAQREAQRDRTDVLLVDTAGRMQDNEPLMRALASLIALNTPDLVLFVGEALVGNDAVDQLTKFNQRLSDLAANAATAHTIDGILLTKFDTIDDKVGAALSMVYSSGAPIMFVGCGQTYIDLKRLNVKSIVHSLLK